MARVPRRLMLLLTGSALLLAPLLAVQLSAGAGRAEACECYPETATELLDKADAVFSGRVISVGQYWEPVVIEVDRVWKGSVGSTTSVNGFDGTSCSYGGFVEGEAHLVYADVSPNDGTLSTWACSGTVGLASLEDASQALQRGREPASETPQEGPAPPTTGYGLASVSDGQNPDDGTVDAAASSGDSSAPPVWAIALAATLTAAVILVRLALRPRLRE